ncbi:MAG: hypothetical protein ACREQ5_25460 [Candidatus Dormibacteria bacterium]
MIERKSDAEREAKLAGRREKRLTELGPTPLEQLAAGVPILYNGADGELIEEYPDGSRFLARLTDGGHTTIHLREF